MAHSSDVANMTWHDSANMFFLLLVCISRCSTNEWWMSSWCATTSALHGKVRGVFDGRWVRLMLHFNVAPCLYFAMLEMFIYSQKFHVLSFIHPQKHIRMFVHLSVHEHIFTCSSIHSFVNTYLHGHLLANKSLCMHRLFIHSWTCPFACTPFFHPIYHHVMFLHVPISIVTLMRWHKIHKSPSLP